MSKKGYKMTDSHKKKLSEIRKRKILEVGYLNSPETRKKMSNARIGRKCPLDERIKISSSKIGKKKTLETRIKMSERLKGNKTNLWKGGITETNRLVRSSFEYRLWRESVFKRDNYTCVKCGIHSGNGKSVILNADHIKPFSQYPELRFAIDNGRTLCINCHKNTSTFGGKVNKKPKE